MNFLYEYLMFLGQVVTLVVGFIVVVSFLASLSSRHQPSSSGYLQINKLNQRIRDLRFSMETQLLEPQDAKKLHKAEVKAEKAQRKKDSKLKGKVKSAKAVVETTAEEETEDNKENTQISAEIDSEKHEKSRVYVIYFDGDVAATAVEHLRIEVTAVLTMATPQDEVIVCIESPGGMVHSYGLAASQMMRIRSKGIPLTAVVDRVAASGGYLMAAVANKIVAAPFAVIGSIGVVAQVPNVHRLLKKNDVDVEVLTAGKYKRTLTLLGENTEEGREKFRQELEEVHALFQEFVVENRPDLDIEAVATGEAWYGSRALDLHLVDALATSDEYVSEKCDERDVYSVAWVEVKKPLDRLLDKANSALDRVNHMLEFVRK